MLIGDYSILDASQIPWNTIIVDEAHSLKSSKSLFLFGHCLRFKNPYTHTVLLTGTPIQNIWRNYGVIVFMDPMKVTSQEEFCEQFKNLAESKDELKELLKTRLLQRLKYLVEKDLAQREEKIIWVELTLFQRNGIKHCINDHMRN
eukprot:TRINITY_DN1427_c0_g1_i1.p1 TRINITY_DN1427_c0_g1~~TRINITY_DN1427_c0_g1_i1.p1  ORF type:complete len:146 (+),score=46.69 TRINITY_DN1427_c0_g1_i1:173-610(+)